MWYGGWGGGGAAPKIALRLASAIAASIIDEIARVVAAIARPLLIVCLHHGHGDAPQERADAGAPREERQESVAVKSRERRCVQCGRARPAPHWELRPNARHHGGEARSRQPNWTTRRFRPFRLDRSVLAIATPESAVQHWLFGPVTAVFRAP